jgi:hypothetical protein
VPLRVALTALVCVLPLWATPAVPTQDGPSHLYNAWVVTALGDPALGLDTHFELVPWAPNWGAVLPLAALLSFLPPAWAETLFLTAVVLAFVLGASRLVARCGGDPLIAAALAGVVAHGLLFVMGFSGYLLALAMGFLLASHAASAAASGARPAAAGREALGWIALELVFAVLFFVHLLGALVAAALWLLVGGASLGPPWRPARLVRHASPLTGLAALVAMHLGREIPPVFPPFRDDPRGAWGRLLEIASGFHWQALSDRDRIGGLGLTALLLALLAARLRQPPASTGSARALLGGAAASLCAFLFGPWAAGGGAFVPERFVPLACLLPLAWATPAGLPGLPRWRALAFGLLGFALVLRGVQYREWGVLTQRLAEASPQVAPGSVVVERARIDAGSVANPLFHLWGRFALRARVVALDDYEAAMPRGLFPVAFRPDTLELARRSRADLGGAPPAGVEVVGRDATHGYPLRR